MKKKACSKCKAFVDGGECPLCKGKQFTTAWKGRVYIIDDENSMIAEKASIAKKGEYAIKI